MKQDKEENKKYMHKSTIGKLLPNHHIYSRFGIENQAKLLGNHHILACIFSIRLHANLCSLTMQYFLLFLTSIK